MSTHASVLPTPHPWGCPRRSPHLLLRLLARPPGTCGRGGPEGAGPAAAARNVAGPMGDARHQGLASAERGRVLAGARGRAGSREGVEGTGGSASK